MANNIPNRIKALPVRKPGPIIAGVVVALLAVWIIYGLVTNENFAWPTVWKYLFNEHILSGVMWTLVLTVVSMAIAIVLAVALAIMRKSTNVVLRWVSWFFIWFFRGTPVYTQLTFWGLISVLIPKISLGVWSWDTQDIITAGKAAILGLALNEAAYLAEIVRAGLEAVDRGQTEAAQALGMSHSLIMRRIILPQSMRIIVPPTGNEAIGLLKTTSLVLAVPFTMELQYMSNNIANRIYEPIPLLIVAAIWYLLITSILMVGQSYLEKYFGRGFDEQPVVSAKNAPKPGKRSGENQYDIKKQNEAFWGGLNA
ncbi:ABC transporter permease [Alloscardovia macacae]|uniref:ABC transporter permease n=1 Tax=Alloscardovia macacae TaxID=1160091 RepID=A0A1Y2SZ83_9BIFI|nr:amino acid ABC transporter permease [Alloscardovia macacae]OTA27403.1 ABC transporter permease [Alloscardovia macacae]OTA29415.1 ABC transporter permease [Alloscardovia macacae]